MPKRAKILIIDDEPAVASLLRDTLRDYQTVCAYNGVQAMKYLGVEPPESIKRVAGVADWAAVEPEWTDDPTPGRAPDLIICDWLMPRIDGFTLLQQLAAVERARSIPVIAITSKSKMAQAFREFGSVVDFVSKPFDPARVLAAVEKALPDQ